MPASSLHVIPCAHSLAQTNFYVKGLSCVVACSMRVFKMDALVGSSNQACLSAALWSLGVGGSDEEYWTCWCQVCITVALISEASKCTMFALPLCTTYIKFEGIILQQKQIVLLASSCHTGHKEETCASACMLDAGTQDTALVISLVRSARWTFWHICNRTD
jgi:hypothetical protein